MKNGLMSWCLLLTIPVGFTGPQAHGQSVTARVDLVWGDRPQSVAKGAQFELSLFAKSARSDGENQSVSAMDVVLRWNPAEVEFVGLNNNGPYSWLTSTFLAGALNDSLTDGDAKYTALARFGAANAAVATPAGLLVTSFRFIAVSESPLSTIAIEPSLGPFAVTQVFGADFVNQDVTGSLSDAVVSIAAPTDCDGNGVFDLREFQRLQSCYTGAIFRRNLGDPPAYPTGTALCCALYDYDDDGDVDSTDHALFTNLITVSAQGP